jgi:hypothetical protein
MIRYLLALLSLRATQGEMTVFEHVRGHSNNVGNDGADALAKRGATQPIIPERDWFAGRRRVESVQAKMIECSKSVENPNVQDPLRFVVRPSWNFRPGFETHISTGGARRLVELRGT